MHPLFAPTHVRTSSSRPGRAGTPRALRHVGRGEPAPRVLPPGDAPPRDEFAADSTPDLSHAVAPEAHPFLEAPAVVVEPLIEERRPELIDQMVVRHRDLDPVEAAVATAARRLAEGAHELGDLLALQLVRDLATHPLGDLRRRQEHVRLLAV